MVGKSAKSFRRVRWWRDGCGIKALRRLQEIYGFRNNRSLIALRVTSSTSSERRLSETARATAIAPAIAERMEAASASLLGMPAASIHLARMFTRFFTPELKVMRNALDCLGKSEPSVTIGHPETLSRCADDT